jgi:quercetin dioxygenase-like cupin family protein
MPSLNHSNIQNLTALAQAFAKSAAPHDNRVVAQFNDHCIRMAVTDKVTDDWHRHPDTDQLLIVVESELVVEVRGELEGERVAELSGMTRYVLSPGDTLTIARGQLHRTISANRVVHLSIETVDAQTVFESPTESSGEPVQIGDQLDTLRF